MNRIFFFLILNKEGKRGLAEEVAIDVSIVVHKNGNFHRYDPNFWFIRSSDRVLLSGMSWSDH